MSKSIVVAAIRTTGLKITKDCITEIALTRYNLEGLPESLQWTLSPSIYLPNEYLRERSEDECAQKLAEWCAGSILIAWNVRLIHGFLKNLLKAQGYSLQCKQLSIEALNAQLGLEPISNLKELSGLLKCEGVLDCATAERHVLNAYLCSLNERFSFALVFETIQALAKRRSVPPKLKTNLDEIPNSPSVYLFYGEHSELPIYIGKSVALRQRILSHFQQDHCSEKEFKMAQQVARIEIIETSGELSALLLESQLIKEQLPLYNQRLRRKKRVVGYQLQMNLSHYQSIQVVTQIMTGEGEDNTILGAFPSVHAAKRHLENLVKTYQLCPKLCGLEKSQGCCFWYQLGRCLGACINEEDSAEYNGRVVEAFAMFKQIAWPYPGHIAIEEGTLENKQWLVFNQWRYLGVARKKSEISNINPDFSTMDWDRDTYRILKQFLKEENSKDSVVIL
ncbi:DNA polymerase-3 subunit epsilon [Legionella quinlivanii DSM 21216]|uniref:GIY-YIG nuclease family protein n=1 Tax=Legionella quinlivanii TaxID=45073 RepID=UPI00089F7F9C|nr:GIY-YIG nuclease family protein [Legionella quinlivanii]SEG41029.1 DNA polymerase-3 subunit epsilon [Legionella quinlivanii DSM 21216]